MRLLCELLLIAALIGLGWEKSFHAWTDQWRGIQPPPPQVAASAPRQPFIPAYRRPPPAATPSGQWMWDPAHRGTLDRPAYDSQKASQSYQESGTRSYWIDAQGVRHAVGPGGATNPPPSPPSP